LKEKMRRKKGECVLKRMEVRISIKGGKEYQKGKGFLWLEKMKERKKMHKGEVQRKKRG